MRLAALLLVLVASCAAPINLPAEPTTTVDTRAVAEPAARPRVERTPPELSAALEHALADACGSCHDSRLRTAKPEALAIFDLVDDNWLVALPEARRQCTLNRLAGDESVASSAKSDLARILEDLRES